MKWIKKIWGRVQRRVSDKCGSLFTNPSLVLVSLFVCLLFHLFVCLFFCFMNEGRVYTHIFREGKKRYIEGKQKSKRSINKHKAMISVRETGECLRSELSTFLSYLLKQRPRFFRSPLWLSSCLKILFTENIINQINKNVT